MRALMLGFILASCVVSGASAQIGPNDAAPADRPKIAVAQSDGPLRPFRGQGAPTQLDGAVTPDMSDRLPFAAQDGFDSRSITAGERIGAQLGADSARMDQLMDAALARGNARILAVKPVTR